MQVHVDRGGERYGPYSLEEVNAYLANGTLLPTDQAWQDGMPNWVPINQIPGVAMSGGATVPPPTPAPVAGATCPQCQAPAEADQVVCMGCGTQLQGAPATAKGSKKKVLISIGAGVGALAIIAGIWFFIVREDGSKEQSAEAKKPEPSKPKTATKKGEPPKPKIVPNSPKARAAILGALNRSFGLVELSLRGHEISDVRPFTELEELTLLSLPGNKINDVSPLKVLKQLKELNLEDNPDLTKAQIAELQKELPNCKIYHNAKK